VNLSKVREAGASGSPASDAAIQQVVAVLGEIPLALETLWKQCDGLYLDSGIVIYETDSIVERNSTYQLEENARGYLLVGDNSGGGGLLLSRSGEPTIYTCDLGFLDAEYFHVVAPSFSGWISDGCPWPE
jgi:hypothetical protein